MPNRILKESIRTSRSVNALTDFQFRLWAYLITYVDDYGRGSAETDIIKGFIFPRRSGVTEANIKAALNGLAEIGLIHLYEVDGEKYLYLRNWEKHQKPRANTSKFPAPPSTCEQMHADASGCEQMPADAPDTRYSINDNRYSILDNDNERESETNGFDSFWKVYPRKVSKQAALKAWKGAKADKLTEVIVADVERRCETEWKGQEVQFIPHPATYLHQRRWEDETPPQERTGYSSQTIKSNPALDYDQRTYSDDEFKGADMSEWMEQNSEWIKEATV